MLAQCHMMNLKITKILLNRLISEAGSWDKMVSDLCIAVHDNYAQIYITSSTKK